MNKTKQLTDYLEELSNKEIFCESEFKTVFTTEIANELVEKLSILSNDTKSLIKNVSQKINLNEGKNLSYEETEEIKIAVDKLKETSAKISNYGVREFTPAMELKKYKTHLLEKEENTFQFIDYKTSGFGCHSGSRKFSLGKVPLDPNKCLQKDKENLVKIKEYFISRKDPQKNSLALERMHIIQPVLDFIEKYESLIPAKNEIK